MVESVIHCEATVHPLDARTVRWVDVVRNEERADKNCDIELQAGNCRILLSPSQSSALARAITEQRRTVTVSEWMARERDRKRGG